MSETKNGFLTPARLREEILRCEFCEEKPCRDACPVHCSPADFIMAARVGAPSDWRRAAAVVMGSNPLGGVCGAVCPDTHCMAACSRKLFDRPIEIPAVQAAIVQRAKDLGVMPALAPALATSRHVAVVGAGPAGLAAAATLAQWGHAVTVFEREEQAGGMCRLIPAERLDPRILETDIEFLAGLGRIAFQFGHAVTQPAELLATGCDAVVVATGLDRPVRLGIRGENLAADWLSYLRAPRRVAVRGRDVAVIGGGAVAVDCALAARRHGAASVELICLEQLDEMPLTAAERQWLLDAGLAVTGRSRLTGISRGADGRLGVGVRRVLLPRGKKFHPRLMTDDPGAAPVRRRFDAVVIAIGARPGLETPRTRGVFYAGDLVNGPTTVVEAAAAGKNVAQTVHAWLAGEKAPRVDKPVKSRVTLAGRRLVPVPLDTAFFGRPVVSPFLLSAAPPTDGYEPMRRAYAAGWAGGVMKTAFDGLPIHIPGAYMYVLGDRTYGNCDNVSGHSLDRVCDEVARLVREYPDRLTMASTGGPVTGDDAADRAVWQSNTRKLEAAGAMGIEYSLSCPQGGDGTHGDIVSQNAALTARIIGWILEGGDPRVPKLFKLTGAVTAIQPIVTAIRGVLERHPAARAGITLANTFPSLGFRPGADGRWAEGAVIGLSGEGVLPISYLTLAKAGALGVPISGNGGPMDYLGAAHFLALGAETVQFCTVAMKYGLGIVDDLHAGLSHLLQALGMASVAELVGLLQPHPIRDFMELSAEKAISAVDRELCRHCGNCTRCPYLAIELDNEKVPRTDPARCVGCSLCAQKCFSGALYMRPRTAEEAAALRES